MYGDTHYDKMLTRLVVVLLISTITIGGKYTPTVSLPIYNLAFLSMRM